MKSDTSRKGVRWVSRCWSELWTLQQYSQPLTVELGSEYGKKSTFFVSKDWPAL